MGDGVDDRAHVVRGNEAMQPYLPRLRIDLNLRDLRADIGHVLGVRRIFINSDRERKAGMGYDLFQACLLTRLLPEPELAATEIHFFRRALQHSSRSEEHT